MLIEAESITGTTDSHQKVYAIVRKSPSELGLSVIKIGRDF